MFDFLCCAVFRTGRKASSVKAEDDEIRYLDINPWNKFYIDFIKIGQYDRHTCDTNALFTGLSLRERRNTRLHTVSFCFQVTPSGRCSFSARAITVGFEVLTAVSTKMSSGL
jgi:hypothetical protein